MPADAGSALTVADGNWMNAPGDGVAPTTDTGSRHDRPASPMGVGLEVGELTAAGEVDGAGESLTRVAAGPVQAPTSAINPKPTHLTSIQRTLPEPGY